MNQPATPAASALSAAQSTHLLGAGGTICCSRCNGSGYLPQYGHVERGRCFRCGGAGSLSGRQAA
ncbi:hypothetical protein [Hymenobacter arcticus]